jgi:hypothetical protein
MKAYWWVEVELHSFFDLGTRWRWVVSFAPRPLYPQGKSPWYPLDRRLSGPQSRSGRCGLEKNSQPRRESNPRTPIVQPVAQRYTDRAITASYGHEDEHKKGKAVPVRFLTEHNAMKSYWGRGYTAPRILDLGTRWRWVVSFTPRPLHPKGKSPWYPLDRRLGRSQSRSWRGCEEKNS